MHYSPLRYPGGKNKLAAFIAKVCLGNNINGHYVEPYSGGASVALFLLIEGFVEQITINDKDRSIYAFWYSVLNRTDEFCELVENAELTISEWHIQRGIQKNKEQADLLDLGFSTFYMNRTNRSGIINAGVMGGMEQTGDYLMDCRFNKSDLIDRIKSISKKRDSIRLLSMDAVDLIDKVQKESNQSNTIFYFDPPYYLKASSLYMNHYKEQDHQDVSERIKKIRNIQWIVSYDNVPEIRKLYRGERKKEYSFSHTAFEAREGKEVLFFSSGLEPVQNDCEDWNPINYKAKRKKGEKTSIVYKQRVKRKVLA